MTYARLPWGSTTKAELLLRLNWRPLGCRTEVQDWRLMAGGLAEKPSEPRKQEAAEEQPLETAAALALKIAAAKAQENAVPLALETAGTQALKTNAV